jgi:hypothetical protein
MLLACLFVHGLATIQTSKNRIRLATLSENPAPGTIHDRLKVYHLSASCVSTRADLFTADAITPTFAAPNAATICDIRVLTKQPGHADLQITADGDTLLVPVHFSDLVNISIPLTDSTLYVGERVLFRLRGTDDRLQEFDTLHGLNVIWEHNTGHIRGVPIDNTSFSTAYDNFLETDKYIGEAIEEVAETVLTATVTRFKQADQAIVNKTTTATLKIIRPFVFDPSDYVFMPGATIGPLTLWRGYSSSGLIVKDSSRPKVELSDVNLTVKNSKIATLNGFVAKGVTIGDTEVHAVHPDHYREDPTVYLHVRNPDSGSWPEQWIKDPARKSEFGGPGPWEPSAAALVLFAPCEADSCPARMPIITPAAIPWVFSDNWRPVGTHEVTASYPDNPGFAVKGIVHTCAKITASENPLYLAIGHDGFVLKVEGGSGFFSITAKDDSIVAIKTTRLADSWEVEFTTKAIGDTEIFIDDQKLTNWNATVRVHVREIAPFDLLLLPGSELYIGDELSWSGGPQTRGESGGLVNFSFLLPAVVAISDQAVLGSDLVGRGIGFAELTVAFGTVRSAPAVVNVFERLTVQNVQGTAFKTLNIGRRNGPVPWPAPHAFQYEAIECPGASVRLLNQTFVEFERSFNGTCTLVVQNGKFDGNPAPIRASAPFEVTLNEITSFRPFIRDGESRDFAGACDMPTLAFRLARRTESIPKGHPLQIEIHAVGPGDVDLGLFRPDHLVVTVTHGGLPVDPEGAIPVESAVQIRVAALGELPEFLVTVTPVAPHYLSRTEDLVLYLRAGYHEGVRVIDGSGRFAATGGNVSVSERALAIRPGSPRAPATIVVVDSCIPGNDANLTVLTDDIAAVELDGPARGAIGHTFTFTRAVRSLSGRQFAPETLALMTFSHTPLEMVPWGGDKYDWVPKAIGVQPVEVTVDGKSARHYVDVFPVPEFDGEIVMFKNRTAPYHLIGGTGDLRDYEYSFGNETVATVDPAKGIVAGSEAGETSLIARLENAPPAKTRVKVIEIYGILIEQSTTTPYVGSYALFRAWLNTSEPKLIFARNVTWSVSGATNWKIDAETLVIRAERPGDITITADCLWLTQSITVTVDYELVVDQTHLLLAIGSSENISVQNDLAVTLSAPGNGLSFGPGNSVKAVLPGRYVVSVSYESQLKTVAVVASDPETLYRENRTQREHVLDPDGQEYGDSDAAHEAKKARAGGEEPIWPHKFVAGEPDDRATRGLFGYLDVDGPNPWGAMTGCLLRVNPGGTVSFEVDPPAGDVTAELVSVDLEVSIGGRGKVAEVTVTAANTFRSPGRIILLHTPSGRKFEVTVEADEAAGGKALLALFGLVGSGGYLLSRLV